MAVVLGWLFGSRLERMIVSKCLLGSSGLDRSDWGGWFLNLILHSLRIND